MFTVFAVFVMFVVYLRFHRLAMTLNVTCFVEKYDFLHGRKNSDAQGDACASKMSYITLMTSVEEKMKRSFLH